MLIDRRTNIIAEDMKISFSFTQLKPTKLQKYKYYSNHQENSWSVELIAAYFSNCACSTMRPERPWSNQVKRKNGQQVIESEESESVI